MQESISGCNRRTEERWVITKILDEFSTNGRSFVKHHLFNQVWWLEITAPMHNKNSTVYICFRSYQLRGDKLPLPNDFPDVYEKFVGKTFAAQLTENSTFLGIETGKVIEMSLDKVIKFLIKNKFKWWKRYFVCMFSSVKHKTIY